MVVIDGGWGNGFLVVMKDLVGGINLVKGGVMIVLFRVEGLWGVVLYLVKDNVDNL